MPTPPRTARPRRALPATFALILTGLAVAPSSAAAAGAPFTCEASVLRGTVLGAPTVEPLVTNRAAPCATTSAGLPALAGIPGISGGALAAATSRIGAADRSDLQQALAGASVADLRVGSLASLGLALPLDAIALPPEATIPPVDITAVAALLNAIPDLPPPLGVVVPTIPNALTIDIQAAVKELLTLPATDLLRLQAASSLAGASCVAGRPATASTRTAAGLSVLGNAVDVDTVGDRPIVDTQTIDPSTIDLAKVEVPVLDALLPLGGNAAVKPLLAQVQAAVTAAVRALPPLAVPIELARVVVRPGTLTKTADSLTQTALEVQLTALGTPVADLVLGEAKVGTAGVDCTPPATAAPPATLPPTTIAKQAPLACTTRRLVLTDVVRKGNRVTITGVADKRFVGRFVTIRFEADGSRAGRARVAANGTFRTTTALPSRKLRSSNRARYQAVLGSEKSLNLKLERRMVVERLTSSAGKVTVRGRVTRPLARPAQTITLSRRVSCKRLEVVKRFKPRADGTFSVTVAAPTGQASAVYRLGTKVRKSLTNRKLFPTFTLPQGVALEQEP